MSAELEVREALVIHDGDTLILRLPSNVSMQQAHDCNEKAKERLAALGLTDVKVLIVAAEEMAVYRPEAKIKKIDIIPLEAKRKP